MAKTHWKKLTNPDYLGAYALEPGKDIVLTVSHLKNEMVIGAEGRKEECLVMYWQERNVKPMIVNATNAKMMAKIMKSPYIEDWAGKKVQIGVERVKAYGDVVDALRIRSKLPAEEKPIPCEECGQIIAGMGNMTASDVAAYTKKKYGKALCSECATRAASASPDTVSDNTKPNESSGGDSK